MKKHEIYFVFRLLGLYAGSLFLGFWAIYEMGSGNLLLGTAQLVIDIIFLGLGSKYCVDRRSLEDRLFFLRRRESR